jgi:hypothetical protein
MRSIDQRTRSDNDVAAVDPTTFFDRDFPALLERNGRLAADGWRHLGLPPLTVDVAGDRRTIVGDGDRLAVRGGTVNGAVQIELDATMFSDWAQELQSLNAMTVARRIRPVGGSFDDLDAWDAVWRALLTGWPVTADDLRFVDRQGAPLDLQRCFTPDDDPDDVAHFLREAGYLHLRGWVDRGDMAVVADDIRRALPSYEEGDGRSWWATVADGTSRCVRLQHFVQYSPTTAAMLTGERWQQLRRALAADDDLVQAPVEGNCIEALVKPLGVVKGISDVPWHRDCNFGRHSYGCAGTIVGVSVTPGGPDSGQLRAVAGSHRVGMPAPTGTRIPYLPIVALPTETGDLTVHLSCTLHEAMPPLVKERLVMYTGFALAPRSTDRNDGGKAISELRERAHLLKSQPPSPLVGRSTPG